MKHLDRGLEGLINLKELNLFDTEVSDAGVADLKKALPNCKVFHYGLVIDP